MGMVLINTADNVVSLLKGVYHSGVCISANVSFKMEIPVSVNLNCFTLAQKTVTKDGT